VVDKILSIREHLLDLPRWAKRSLVFLIDTFFCVLALWLSLYLRLGEFVSLNPQYHVAIIFSIITATPIFIVSGLYRAIFRYANWQSLMTIAKAVLLYGLIYAFLFTAIGIPGIPRTVGLLQPITLFLLIALSRAVAFYWLGYEYKRRIGAHIRERVLVYGAGEAGRQIAAALSHHKDIKIIGFIDDNPSLIGQVLNGLTIYDSQSIKDLAYNLNVNSILLAMPSINRKTKNKIINKIQSLEISVRTLPSVIDIASGRVTVADIKDLDIDDLLGRDRVEPDPQLLAQSIKAGSILVTGAGGSIGSELCRQIIRQEPKHLVLIDHSEYALFSIIDDLQRLKNYYNLNDVQIHPLLGSVQNEQFLSSVFKQFKLDVIFHAAAYKHVSIIEDNIEEGIKNNIFGTNNLARLALDHHVLKFILVSTDKAVRASTAMGATKRWAELIVQNCAAEAKNLNRNQSFSIVRFGNVLGSSGSVVPIFKEQLKSGGPITLTDEEATRYFMSINEAAELILQATTLAEGGEIFLLDMGQPVKIKDLAMTMVRLSGLTIRDDNNPDGDIEIIVTGLRSGEKLHEELLIEMSSSQVTKHPKIYLAREPFLTTQKTNDLLSNLSEELKNSNVKKIRTTLFEAIQ